MSNDIYSLLYTHQFKDSNLAKFYLDRYVKFIESRKNRILKEETYTERHHILPKSWGGDNSKENLIQLTAREHFIAHEILYFTKDKSMIFALWRFLRCKNYKGRSDIKINSKLYEIIRIEQLKILKEKCKEYRNLNPINGENNPNYGHKWTEEMKRIFSEKMKGKYKNTIYMNKDGKNVRILKKEIEKYKKVGFKIGRINIHYRGNSKKVECIETNEVFDSAKKLSLMLGKCDNYISQIIKKHDGYCKFNGLNYRYV